MIYSTSKKKIANKTYIVSEAKLKNNIKTSYFKERIISFFYHTLN